MRKIAAKLAGYRAETDPRDFIPFSVSFDMVTPVMLGHPYINGDALIMRLVLREILGEDFYNLPAKAPIEIERYLSRIPIRYSAFQQGNRQIGIYHASVSQFDIDKFYIETLYKRFETRHIDQCQTRKKKIRLGMGFFKAFMMKIPYTPAKSVTFYIDGGKEEITGLIRHVTHLGKKTGYGFGKVRGVRVEEIEKDLSIVKDGKAMRPVPEKIHAWGLPSYTQMLAYRPPYWDKRNVALCAAPGCTFYANAGSSA